MPALRIDHAKCTECRMCYVVCREININAVAVSPVPQHFLEIDERCVYPKCTVCLMYCPAEDRSSRRTPVDHWCRRRKSGRKLTLAAPALNFVGALNAGNLKDFLDKWVYPTGFSGAGVEFRLCQTERCLPLWDKLLVQAIAFAERDLKSGDSEYKAVRAREVFYDQ